MINQQEWLRTRKNLLDEVKSQVQVRLGPPEPALRRYSIGLETEFKNGWRASSLKELHQALNKAKVVLGADFHAYSQSQRAHVRLLRDQIRRPVVLALECLLVEHEEAAESYLAGNISEDRFLDELDWEKNWGFPWFHYRPLFELSRERTFP